MVDIMASSRSKSEALSSLASKVVSLDPPMPMAMPATSVSKKRRVDLRPGDSLMLIILDYGAGVSTRGLHGPRTFRDCHERRALEPPGLGSLRQQAPPSGKG